MEIVIVIGVLLGLLFIVVKGLDKAAEEATNNAIEKENDIYE